MERTSMCLHSLGDLRTTRLNTVNAMRGRARRGDHVLVCLSMNCVLWVQERGHTQKRQSTDE